MRLLRQLHAGVPGSIGSRAWRLALLLGLALVPLLVSLPLAVVSAPYLAEAEFGASLAQHALSAQRGWIDGVRQVLVAAARSSDITSGDAARCNAYVQGITAALPHYTGLGFIGTDGHEACSPDRVPRLYLGDRGYFRETLRRGDFTVGEFLIGRTTGRKVLGFGLPARDARQQIVGVVYATLDLETVSRQMLAQWPREDVHIRLVDGQGAVIMTNRPDHDRLGEPLGPVELRSAATGGRTATLSVLDEGGRRWDHRVEPGPAPGLAVLVSQTRSPLGAFHVVGLLLAAALLTVALRRFWRATGQGSAAAPAVGAAAAAGAQETGDALRDHEALRLLRHAIARIGDVVILAERPIDGGPETLRIVYVNEAYERLTGFPLGELTGAPLRGPALNEPALARVRTAMQSRVPVREELALVSRDGRLLWFDTDISPLPDAADGRVHVIAVQRDITEQKAAYEAAGAAARRLQDTLHGMSDGFIVLDLDWRYSFVNAQAAAVLGQTVQTMLGRYYGELFPEAIDNEFGRACRATREEGLPRQIELEYGAWKRWFACHMYPTLDGVAVFFHEVTARKRAEAGTEKLVRRLHALRQMDAALVQVWSVDEVAHEGLHHARLLTAAGRAALVRHEAASGRRPALVLDDQGFRSMPEGSHDPSPALWASLRADGLLRDEAQLLAAWPAAHSLLALPLLAEGSLLGALVLVAEEAQHFDGERLAVARDIADRLAVGLQQAAMRVRIEGHAMELERRVGERASALLVANRELEAFSYSLSHDLGAPADAIAKFSEALDRHAERLDDEGRHLLQRIRANARRMTEIMVAMLSLANLTHAESRPEPVDVGALAEEVVGDLRDRDPSRRPVVRIDAGLRVVADRAMLRVVLENLLGNAWKFTSHTPDARIEVVSGEAGRRGGPWLVVRDNGAGFDMDRAQRLFMPFRRLHSVDEFPGSGIGLATVRRIVELHGGRIEARSRVGGPTEFEFSIPSEPTGRAARAPG